MVRLPFRGVLCLTIVLALGAPGYAQEFRGSINGTVADSFGGVLPGVTVTVTNTETAVKQVVVSDSKGAFQVAYLNAGPYTVAFELSGFRPLVRTGNAVRVGEPLALDVVLVPGGVSEAIEVTAERPVLTVGTGITGTVVDAKQIEELPLGDGTAYMLTRLAPGITDTSDLHFARPMDNANMAGIVSNGAQGGNEFSIDGAPNMSNARGVGFSPPSDAISQFKVQTNSFDAQVGHTAGAVVNLAIKSGTNALHFGGGYFNRDASRSETPLLTLRAGGSKPTREYNRMTGTLTGPIRRDKTFFLFSAEHLRDVQPEPATYTVPTEKMRQGDFSEFTTTVYDPLTATGTNGARTAFGGNVIPANRINPVAATYASYYPLPNRPGTESNYFTNGLRPYDYNAFMGRLDHNLNGSNRMYATAYYNKRQEDRYNWAMEATNGQAGVINDVAVTRGYDYRSNLGLTGGWTSLMSPTLFVDLKLSYTRFGEYRDPAQTVDPASLGFSATALKVMNGYAYLPFMTIGSFSTTNQNSTIASLGSQRSDWGEGFNRPMATIALAPTVTKLWGGHTVRAGYDLRLQTWEVTNAGFPGGRFQFNGAYTRLNNSAPTNDRAQSWAQFLLGLPTATNASATAAPGTQSSQFEIISPGVFTQSYHGLFVQDDWRVNSRLSLNLGLRVEINSGMRETANRNLAGFDTSSASPVEAAAKAAYAANPIPQLAAANFQVKGGLRFADGPVNDTVTKAHPRAAFSYRIGERMVLRGGAGLFSYDYFFENINQTGFSQATPIQITTDNGLTFTGANLSNPLPGGALIQPIGSSQGLASQLGTNLGTLYQPGRKAPHYRRWEISLQRDLGAGWVVLGQYVGSSGVDLPVARQVNNIPISFLSTSRMRDTANESLLTGNVTNPFAGLAPGSTLNNATVQRQVLLRPYPQFGTFAIEEYTGSDRYRAGTIQIEKRFKSGNSFTVQFTRSSLRDKLNFLNPADGVLEDRVSPNDRPNRLSIGSSYRLPIGRGQRWGTDWNAPLDAVAGGWQLGTTYQYQSGFPITFGNVYFDGSCDIGSLTSRIGEVSGGKITGLDSVGWDVSCFYFHDAAVQTNGADDPAKQRADTRIQLGNNVRYFPSTVAGLRNESLHLLDIGVTKNFALPHHARLQVRIEFINALNYTVLFSPGADPRNATFGLITADRNNPRDIQIGLRLTF